MRLETIVETVHIVCLTETSIPRFLLWSPRFNYEIISVSLHITGSSGATIFSILY